MIFLPLLFDNSKTIKFSNNPTTPGIWGIEREQLRVNADGSLSQRPTPAALLEKNRHGFATTDFSESQMEVVTAPRKGIEGALESLERLIGRAYRHLAQGESLWPASLPGLLPRGDRIPLAYSGQADPAEALQYRKSLAGRYGYLRMMISGIHINASFPEDQPDSQSYMNGARRFLRDRWLLIWLFGSSPVVPPVHRAEMAQCVPSPWKDGFCLGRSFFQRSFPYAVSLRMSCFGYPSQPSSLEAVSFNSLEEYTQGLESLLQGKGAKGLSKESELYLPVRLKSSFQQGESLNAALRRRGAEYLEMRTVDVNPLEPLGLDPDEMRLQYLILKTGMVRPLKPETLQDRIRWNRNHHTAALMGRKETAALWSDSNQAVPLRFAAERNLEELEQTARGLPDSRTFLDALNRARVKVEHPGQLPSSRISREAGCRGEKYVSFVLKKAREHQDFFLKQEVYRGKRRMGAVHTTGDARGREERSPGGNPGSTGEFYPLDRFRPDRIDQGSHQNLPGQLHHLPRYGE